LYNMQFSNAFRLLEYKSAYLYDSIIIAKYSHVCDSTEIISHKDDVLLFRNIMNAPKMEIKIPANSMIPLKRDIANYQNISVLLQNDSIDFLFDTGANFSAIIESVAKKYGVKILGGKVNVGTSTGKEVEGQMGLLNFKLGNIEIKNAVFIVFPDSVLTFANGQYIIKGVIGFPVMYALREFSFKDDKFMIVPQKSDKTGNRNLAFFGQYLMIMVTYQKDTLPFIFDSGASGTELSSLFYNKYKNEIVGKCRKEKVTNGGAGGYVQDEVYIIDSTDLAAGNSQFKLNSLRIHPKDLNEDMKYVYGNFGQDYVNKFSEMKINLTCMNISFTNKKNK
jgi:hypothetical protein